jgi:D-alanyl-lipoteichoic acid acyltransferase DltB (MBOAT superfamily)
MNFTQPVYFLLLFITFSAFWLLRGRREAQLALLNLASAVFYGWWDWRFLGLMGFVILVCWATALYADSKPKGERSRRIVLTLGIGVCLAVLAVFKYFNFFAGSAVAALNALGLNANPSTLTILLPVGISFFTFQAISYVIDVARGDMKAAKRLDRVSLYVAFFPQLVAGPIVRAKRFFPQMESDRRLTPALMTSGLKAFLLGFAYKAGIADNLAPLVDPVFGDARLAGDTEMASWSNSALIGATMAFAGQIYFDFAGYSLMAIGVARWFGFNILRNFDYPYASASIDDFWRRWHISLSSWLRDYLYIPLGGNRLGNVKTYRNLMLTMLLGGLWHGAAWTFVAWGAMHGAALAVHRALFGRDGRRIGFWAGLIVTQAFVLMTWAPFRAETFTDTLTVWHAFTGLRDGGDRTLPLTVWFVPLLIFTDVLLGRTKLRHLGRAGFLRQPLVYWAGLGALIAVLFALFPLEARPFVYFQF